MARQLVVERFRAKFTKDPKTGCLLWTGAKDDSGYGLFWLRGKLVRAHRLSYRMARGPFPKSAQIFHPLLRDPATRAQCSRSCVNAAHLEMRSVKKG